jgi:hypothetical protein
LEDYLTMEQRWLALARSYECTERLSRFTVAATKQTVQIADVQADDVIIGKCASRTV